MAIECDDRCRTCHPRDVECAKCGQVIPRQGQPGELPGNLDGGMQVTFDGWYGGTIDPFPEGVRLTFCDSCARAFLVDNGWLGRAHEDLEIRTPTTSPVSGRVTYIDHHDGVVTVRGLNDTYVTFRHLASVRVSYNDEVEPGTIIGYVVSGDPKRALHVEVR